MENRYAIIKHGDSDSMETSESMSPIIDKMDPRYIAACIKQLPSLSDPQERGIVSVMEEVATSTSLGKRMVEKEKQIVRASVSDILAHIGDSIYTRDRGRATVAEIARIMNSEIVSGREKLQGIEKGKPVFFSANHLGMYKLAGLTPQDLREIGFQAEHEIPDVYYPPIPFYSPFYPIAKEIGDDICMAAFEEPGKLGELSRATGYLDVPPIIDNGSGKGRVEIMTEESREFFQENPESAILVFPEGGTTGKRNGGRIYDMGEFHTGTFVIASRLGVPVVLLAHRFNPGKGFEVAVVDVMHLNKDTSREEIQRAALVAQSKTQAALNELQRGVQPV